MDKYALLVFLLAPGFIASTVATFCGNFPDKHTEFGYIMRYFAYSFFTLAISLLMSCGIGYIDTSGTWANAMDSMDIVSNSLAFVVVSLASAVLVGIAWPLYLQERFLKACNAIKSRKTGRTTIYSSRIIDDFFCGDDSQKPMLIEFCKGDKVILGFMETIGSANNDDLEFSMFSAEGYREWLGTRECHIIRTYVNVDKDITLRQYSYPPEWLEERA